MSASTPRPGSGRSQKAAGGGATRKPTSRRASGPKKPLTPRERVRKALKYILIAGLVGALVLVAMFYIAYRATDIPSENAAFQAQTTKVYYAGGKGEIGRFATQNRESIPLADVPKVMQDAAVAISAITSAVMPSHFSTRSVFCLRVRRGFLIGFFLTAGPAALRVPLTS